MSLHKSLKSTGALSRHRNVLTRAERVAKLLDQERWEEGDSVFGLPKVKVRRVKAGRHKKKAKEEAATEAAEAAEGEEAAEGAEAPDAGEE